MRECGCGQINLVKALKINENKTIGIDLYGGCKECNPLIGVRVYLFDKKGRKHWVDDLVEEEQACFDEFGGNKGYGYSVTIIEADALGDAIIEHLKLFGIYLDEVDADIFRSDHVLEILQKATFKNEN